jgi:hypothetical protein
LSKSPESTAAERIVWPLHPTTAALQRKKPGDDLIAFFEAFDNFGADTIGNPSLNFDWLQFGTFALC